MPNHDASLYLRAYNGFKPYYEDVEKYIPKSILSFGTQDGIIHDYLYANGRTPENGEKGYIDSYYGFYNNTFVLKMSTNKSDYTEAEGVETVGGVTFHYNNGNRILAYKNGKFYSLQEAYNNGYLTTTDLQNCLTFNNDYIEPIKYSLNEIVDVSLSNIKEVEFKRWGAIETTYKLSNKGITDFISDINTNYTLSSQEEIYLLNNVETGLFFKYTVYTKGLTFEVCPIYTTPKIYIKINDKIYLSYNEIKLSNDYDKENEEKIVNTISLDLVNEIKISYIKTYRSEKTPLTLEEFDKIKIRYYLGIFNGYHVVMIDGYNSLYQTPMLDIIGDITFNYTDNNYFLVYKDGFFDTLSNAYKKGLITNKLINEINNLYINSTPYNIIIEDYKTDDKLVLSDLVDISLYEYINVIDIKKKELIINELEFTNLSVDTKELINKILASECVLLDEISIKTLISKEYEISLSNKPSFSSYKYFISFILGQNMIYSSIKVELIVEVNNVKYLVNADRNDLFTLYNLIIKYQKGQENKDIILSDLLDINTLNRVYISNATDDLVSTNVRLEDLNEDTKNIIKRILASKCIVLDKNMLIQDEYNLIVKGEDDHYTFTFGENMLYSSIKKELVIKFTDVSYLIQADRDDLFNLYLLIKKHEDLFNQSELKFDEIYPMLNDEITKISVINRINDLSSETSLYILNNIDSLSFQGINYVNNLKYYEVDQKDQLNTIIEKLKEITLMNISNNKVVTDYPQYMFPLTISSIAIIKPLDMYTYIIETENDKIELFIMANGTDYFTFIDGVFFNVSNIIEETFLPEPLICDYLRFPSTSISDIKEYIQRRLDTGIKSNILNFSDCFPWINEINVEDIISIKQINELNETKEINDKEIISKLFDSLKNDKLLLSLNLIELSLNPVRYEICTKDNTYRFEKNSGYIVYKGNIFVIGSYLEDAFID